MSVGGGVSLAEGAGGGRPAGSVGAGAMAGAVAKPPAGAATDIAASSHSEVDVTPTHV